MGLTATVQKDLDTHNSTNEPKARMLPASTFMAAVDRVQRIFPPEKIARVRDILLAGQNLNAQQATESDSMSIGDQMVQVGYDHANSIFYITSAEPENPNAVVRINMNDEGVFLGVFLVAIGEMGQLVAHSTLYTKTPDEARFSQTCPEEYESFVMGAMQNLEHYLSEDTYFRVISSRRLNSVVAWVKNSIRPNILANA